MSIRHIKIGIAGYIFVGKSSLANSICKIEFDNEYYQTCGVNYSSKYYEIDKEKANIKIFDFSGSNNYFDIVKTYIKLCSIIIYVYDVNNIESIYHIKLLHDKFKNLENEKYKTMKFIVIGNKCDNIKSMNYKQIIEIAEDFSERISNSNFNHYIISCKKNEGIDKVISCIINMKFNENKTDCIIF
jgi:small GTP-binding protein